MWISIRSLRGLQFEQVLPSCGLQGWTRLPSKIKEHERDIRTFSPYPDLGRFWARQQDWSPLALERSKVYWSRLTLVHSKSQGSYPHKTSLWYHQQEFLMREYQRSRNTKRDRYYSRPPREQLGLRQLGKSVLIGTMGSKSANRIKSP